MGVTIFCLILGLVTTLAHGAPAPDVVEKAKAEGKLVWWGGGTEAEDREFIKRFNQKYPFVAVEQWNTSSKATQERVWAEFTAKKFSWDVVTGGGRAAQDWVKAGIMQKWSLEAAGRSERPQWLLRAVWLQREHSRLQHAARLGQRRAQILGRSSRSQMEREDRRARYHGHVGGFCSA